MEPTHEPGAPYSNLTLIKTTTTIIRQVRLPSPQRIVLVIILVDLPDRRVVARPAVAHRGRHGHGAVHPRHFVRILTGRDGWERHRLVVVCVETTPEVEEHACGQYNAERI